MFFPDRKEMVLRSVLHFDLNKHEVGVYSRTFSSVSTLCAWIALNVYYIHSVLTFMLQANTSSNTLSFDYIIGSVSVGLS